MILRPRQNNALTAIFKIRCVYHGDYDFTYAHDYNQANDRRYGGTDAFGCLSSKGAGVSIAAGTVYVIAWRPLTCIE